MDLFLQNCTLGYHVAFTAINLLYCFVGVFIGTLIGVLPGIGPAGAIALLLPVTYGIEPVSAIIMISGIYYGAQYGGSTTSILVNIPGESSSIMTCLDGYQMARQGRAGPALGIAAFGSFIAGTTGTIILMFLAEPLSNIAVSFGPAEYCSLMILGLTMIAYLARGSIYKAIVMALLGFIVSQIGIDIITGHTRFTFGIARMEDGISLVPLVMGLFGISEILKNLEGSINVEIFKTRITGLLPTLRDWKDSIGPIGRGTCLGFFLGLLPGGGAVLSSFMSYALEKRISKHPEKFGTGVIQGVAGPESANNAGTSGAFIPLFSLGIPSNAITALLLGAFMVHGLTPGPFLIKNNPEIFYGTIMSIYIGNVMLLVLNLPLIGLWVRLLKVPYGRLFPFMLFFCVIGAYSINMSTFDILIMIIFGILGYVFKELKYELSPFVLAFILGSRIESSLRQALLASQGNFFVFFQKPISLTCLVIAVALILLGVVWGKKGEFSD